MKNNTHKAISSEYKLHSVVYGTCSLVFGIFASVLYLKDFHMLPLGKYLLIAASFVAFTLTIERSIFFSPLALRSAWIYRLSFLGTVCFGVLLWVYQLFTSSMGFNPSIVLSSLFGAVVGSLILTKQNGGLVEINLQPSEKIKSLVKQIHDEVIKEPLREPWQKRSFDFIIAIVNLVIFAPVFLVIAFLIWWEDPGPIFFIKNSIGKDGCTFWQFKFRTMIINAEKTTGPILACKDDQRILWIGNFLRKSALDELPQIINILRGDMSFIGPRPQRTVLVYGILRKMPQFAERHKVRPGLAGLAQVWGHYYVTPFQKLRFDRLYIRNISFRLDIKLLLSALLVVYMLRWKKDWNGHLPVSWRKSKVREKPVAQGFVSNNSVSSQDEIIASEHSGNSPLIRQPYWARCLAWLLTKSWRASLVSISLDILSGAIGLLAAFILSTKYLRVEAEFHHYIAPFLAYNVFLILVAYLISGYRHFKTRPTEIELKTIVASSCWALFLVFAINFIFFKDIIFSRYIFLLGFIISLTSMFLLRFGTRALFFKLWDYGLAKEDSLIVGDSLKEIQWLLDHLKIQRYYGFNILGYIAEKPIELNQNLNYLGDIKALRERVHEWKLERIFFAPSGYNRHKHQTLISHLEECAKLNITAMIISPIFKDFNYELTLDGYTGIFAIDRREPAYANLGYRCLKRSIDIVGSAMGLLLSLPLWPLVMLCIKIFDGSPVFYTQPRVGKGGKIFNAIKFRTMVVNAEKLLNKDQSLFAEFNKKSKLKDDPRITITGKWLRRFSLDELPQLVNILKGDMSLVGPRPVDDKELERYGNFKYERQKIRPGLTGFWQVSGRSFVTYEERIQMDKFYMYKCNFWMDLVILLKTPIKVILGDGAL